MGVSAEFGVAIGMVGVRSDSRAALVVSAVEARIWELRERGKQSLWLAGGAVCVIVRCVWDWNF
jgi:hypothetical protein